MKKETKLLAKVATGSAVLAALAGLAPQAQAHDAVNFSVLGSGAEVRSDIIQSLGGTFQVANDEKAGEGKCGEAKCGAKKDHKAGEGKCGEAKCGAKKDHKSGEGKCGEAKCGAKK